MKLSTLAWILAAVIVILAAIYFLVPKTAAAPTGPSTNLGTNGSPDQGNTGEPVTPVVTLASDATLGSHLVAANGMTLYYFTQDTNGVSTCTDTCAANWPAYTVSGASVLLGGNGITGTLATIAGGQVTYKGMPLYFYAKDAKPGDTLGQGVKGTWYVVAP